MVPLNPQAKHFYKSSRRSDSTEEGGTKAIQAFGQLCVFLCRQVGLQLIKISCESVQLKELSLFPITLACETL